MIKKSKPKKPDKPSYFSVSKLKYVEVGEMPAPHIVNAIKALEGQLTMLRKELRFREFERSL